MQLSNLDPENVVFPKQTFVFIRIVSLSILEFHVGKVFAAAWRRNKMSEVCVWFLLLLLSESCQNAINYKSHRSEIVEGWTKYGAKKVHIIMYTPKRVIKYRLDLEGWTKYGAVNILCAVLRKTLFSTLSKEFKV